jgi:anti-sigma B factor antagonist
VTTTEPVLRRPSLQIPAPRSAGEPAAAASADTALRLSVCRIRPGTAVLTATGDVDVVTAPRLEDMLANRLRGTLALLILDLSGLDFLGVAGLSLLVRAKLQAEHHGTELRIVIGDNRPVRRALAAAGLQHSLPLSEAVTTA